MVDEITLDVLTGGAATVMSAARKINRFSFEMTGEKPFIVKAEEAAVTAIYTAVRTVADVVKAILKGGVAVNGVYPKEGSDSSSGDGK
ncbi:MAG: hypothetical protein ACI4PK_03525 [Oscillospiraceae bacterium]